MTVATETRTGVVKDGHAEGGVAWLEFEDGSKVFMDSFGARQIAEAAAEHDLLFLPGVAMVYETESVGSYDLLISFDFTSEVLS